MVRANSKPVIFTRTTEPTHNQRSIFAPFSLAGEGLGMRGMKMQYVKSNMRERQVQMIIKDNLITHD